MMDVKRSFQLVDRDGDAVNTTWCWAAERPYLIQVTFHHDGEDIPWEFDRELLVDAVVGDSGGEADVQIRRLNDHAMSIRLSSHDGVGILIGVRSDLQGFLADTLRSVPRAREAVQVDDDALAAWMAGA